MLEGSGTAGTAEAPVGIPVAKLLVTQPTRWAQPVDTTKAVIPSGWPANLDFSNVGRFGSVSAVVDGRLAVWIGYATVFESPDCRFARRESTGCDLPAIRVYQVARRGSGQAKGRRAIAEERFMRS